MNSKHIPKGFMCCVCTHAHRLCNHLEFDKMIPLVKHKDGWVEVKCVEFEKGEKNG